MMNFLATDWDSVIVVILFIFFLLFLAKRDAIKQIKKILFYLVTEAEKEFGSGTGELKFAAVTTWLYEKLPAIVKFFFTSKQIDRMIEEAVGRMKSYLGRVEAN